MGAAAVASDPAAKHKKIRIQAFDSMRFFLILNIVLGHFISFAKPSTQILKFFSQHNVLVGPFFALSGYVTVRTGIYRHSILYERCDAFDSLLATHLSSCYFPSTGLHDD